MSSPLADLHWDRALQILSQIEVLIDEIESREAVYEDPSRDFSNQSQSVFDLFEDDVHQELVHQDHSVDDVVEDFCSSLKLDPDKPVEEQVFNRSWDLPLPPVTENSEEHDVRMLSRVGPPERQSYYQRKHVYVEPSIKSHCAACPRKRVIFDKPIYRVPIPQRVEKSREQGHGLGSFAQIPDGDRFDRDNFSWVKKEPPKHKYGPFRDCARKAPRF